MRSDVRYQRERRGAMRFIIARAGSMQEFTLTVQRGFTLVELLVTLAIIAVLAGLIFPVFGATRERARSAQCISNLRQVYGAIAMYSSDHEGLLPPFRTFDLEAPTSDQAARLVAATQPYLRSTQVWFCPSDVFAGQNPGPSPKEGGAADHRYTSFRTLLDWSLWSMIAQGRHPAHSHVLPSLDSETELLTDNVWMPRRSLIAYSHSQTFNHLMGDGRVVTRPWREDSDTRR